MKRAARTSGDMSPGGRATPRRAGRPDAGADGGDINAAGSLPTLVRDAAQDRRATAAGRSLPLVLPAADHNEDRPGRAARAVGPRSLGPGRGLLGPVRRGATPGRVR